MYFKKNFNNKFNTDPSKSPLLAFFNERNKEELNRLAAELSGEAKEFFDESVVSLLGQMPDEVAETVLTMSRSALSQLLYSSMITGYLTKAVENKLELEKLWSPDQDEDESTTLMDKLIQSPKFYDDIDKIM